jgi:hypothetical protein
MKGVVSMKTKIFSISLIIMMLLCVFMSFKPMQTSATDATVTVKGGKVVLSTGYSTQDAAFSHILDKYKTIITFFAALGAVTMVAVFIYNFVKLGTTSSNPQERSKCLTGLIISGVAAALLGSTSLFVGLFYNAFKD